MQCVEVDENWLLSANFIPSTNVQKSCGHCGSGAEKCTRRPHSSAIGSEEALGEQLNAPPPPPPLGCQGL